MKNKTKIAPIDPPRKLLQGPLGNTSKDDIRAWGENKKKIYKNEIDLDEAWGGNKKKIYKNEINLDEAVPSSEKRKDMLAVLLNSDTDSESEEERVHTWL